MPQTQYRWHKLLHAGRTLRAKHHFWKFQTTIGDVLVRLRTQALQLFPFNHTVYKYIYLLNYLFSYFITNLVTDGVWRRRRSRRWKDLRISWGVTRLRRRKRLVRIKISTTSRRDWRRRTSNYSARCKNWTQATRHCPRPEHSSRLNWTKPRLVLTRKPGSVCVPDVYIT